MQKTKGISLIVLVITIIVMIILAGAIILSLNNSGIIDKASDTVEETNLATVKQLTQMAWSEAYARGERTEEGLKESVDKALVDNKVDTNKYAVEVTTKGVIVVLKGPWKQEGLTVTNGKVTLEIGDSIAYDETNGGLETGLKETGWKLLGASDYGELLIMSDRDIAAYSLGYKATTTDSAERLKEAQNSWLNGMIELDAICEVYGKGAGATSARSVTEEYIDKITGYDKTTYATTGLHAYGNIVTYTYNGTTKPTYICSNGKTGALSKAHNNGFHFYDGEAFVHVNDLTTGINGVAFATLKSDFYTYVASDLETIEYGSKAYSMVFGDNNTYYWLASQCVLTYGTHTGFGMRFVEAGYVNGKTLWTTRGDTNNYALGVRAVVTLMPDIQLKGSSESGWTF